MKTIKPKKLKKGDTIGIIAVSGKIKEYERILRAKAFFEKSGYSVIVSDTCRTSHRYMAGNNDDECINILHDFFLDKNIDMILCARGGYGTLRLINKIDWDIIRNHPKIFAGYSDITILLNMIYKKAGLITFHSPMANGDFGDNIEEYTKNNFFSVLEGIITDLEAQDGKTYYNGKAKGRLWGGNLASLNSLCGIDFIPDDDLILFLEDLNEPVYKIDRMLTQLFNINKLRENVKGIVLGEFKDIEDKNLLDEVIQEFADSLKIPVHGGFKITHGKIKDTVPVGIKALFDADEGLIHII